MVLLLIVITLRWQAPATIGAQVSLAGTGISIDTITVWR